MGFLMFKSFHDKLYCIPENYLEPGICIWPPQNEHFSVLFKLFTFRKLCFYRSGCIILTGYSNLNHKFILTLLHLLFSNLLGPDFKYRTICNVILAILQQCIWSRNSIITILPEQSSALFSHGLNPPQY